MVSRYFCIGYICSIPFLYIGLTTQVAQTGISSTQRPSVFSVSPMQHTTMMMMISTLFSVVQQQYSPLPIFSPTPVMHFFPHKAVPVICSSTHCWRSRFRISLLCVPIFLLSSGQINQNYYNKNTRLCKLLFVKFLFVGI